MHESLRAFAKETPQLFATALSVAVLMAVGLMVSMCTSKVEPVLVELSVDRAEFVVANFAGGHGADHNVLRTSSVGFLDLSLAGFQEILHEGESSILSQKNSLRGHLPDAIQGALRLSADPATDSGMTRATFQGAVQARNSLERVCPGQERLSHAGTIRGTTQKSEKIIGRLSPLTVASGARIVIESTDSNANSYSMALDGSEASTSLLVDAPLKMELQSGAMQTGEMRYDPGIYEVDLKSPHLAHVVLGSRRAQASFRLPCDQPIQFLRGGTATWIEDVRFERFGEEGIWSSTVSSATISYPEHSFIYPVAIKGPSGLFFERGARLRLEKATTNPQTGMIDIQLSGKIAAFKTGTLEFEELHEVTFFQILWERPVFVALLGGFGLLLNLLLQLTAGQWANLANDSGKKNE